MPKEEQIRASIDNIDAEVLKDTLAILLSQNTPSQPVQKNEVQSNYKNFAQAILDLKKKYKFPELNHFTTEADLVYVQAGDRRVLLTDREAQMEMARPTPTPEVDDTENDNQNDTPTPTTEKDSIENAFENIKPNDSRFSHLEF